MSKQIFNYLYNERHNKTDQTKEQMVLAFCPD